MTTPETAGHTDHERLDRLQGAGEAMARITSGRIRLTVLAGVASPPGASLQLRAESADIAKDSHQLVGDNEVHVPTYSGISAGAKRRKRRREGHDALHYRGERTARPIGWTRSLLRCQEGQGLVEYGLTLVLVAVALTLALALLGGRVRSIYRTINTEFYPTNVAATAIVAATAAGS